MKTNKSYTKRLKVTKTGKVLARKPGQNHFQAKKTGTEQLQNKQLNNFNISNKKASRFLPGQKVN